MTLSHYNYSNKMLHYDFQYNSTITIFYNFRLLQLIIETIKVKIAF